MSVFIKSPFKCNNIEDDPFTYGLRELIIKKAALELLNNHSILISGSRGIGKSSFIVQLQNVLNGDKTLIERCELDVEFAKHITITYTCLHTDSLESIILSIIDILHYKMKDDFSKPKCKLEKLELSICAIKATVGIKDPSTKLYSTLAKQFVDVFKILREEYADPLVSIALDELDQLNDNINVANFIKVVLEMLAREGYRGLSFIFAGQDGIYKKMLTQQPAFERIVTHIKLEPLDEENAEYVLDSLLAKSENIITIKEKAKELLLGISSGYPYSIHLLGHESFCSMLERYLKKEDPMYIILDDFVHALNSILENKQDKYDLMIDSLNDEEKNIVYYLSEIQSDVVPINFNKYKIIEECKDYEPDKIQFILQSLCEKNILRNIVTSENIDSYQFREELFRIYITYSIDKSNYELMKSKLPEVKYTIVSLDAHKRFLKPY